MFFLKPRLLLCTFVYAINSYFFLLHLFLFKLLFYSLFPFVPLVITSWRADMLLLTQHIVTFQSDSLNSASPADYARWVLFELLPKYYMPQKINTDLWIWNKMVMHSNSSWFPWGIIPLNGLKFKRNTL